MTTKDNWIKAFDEILSDCLEEIGMGPKKEAKLKAFISQVEKDAINRLNHDHEILVNTILETKKREIEDAKSESYTNGFREGFDAGVEKTNKRWESDIKKLEDKHWWEIRKRCLLYGCVYGNPFIDKKPKEYCEFCGEPNAMIDNDFWYEPSPAEALNKVLNKYKDNPKALSDLLEDKS